ncbi:MAG: recombinase family protein, partial [Candidatus Entotheonellia bacterium]
MDACRKVAAEHGYAIPDALVIADEGFSGDWLDRPGFVRLHAFIRSNAIQAVFAQYSDRLSRKSWVQGMLLDELRAAGVALYIGNRLIGQDRASRMLFGIQSTLDEDVKLGILERRRRVDRADWVWLDVPAIITRPTFDAAQAQLQKNYERSNRHMRSECQYFLRGRWFKCAACQGAMYGHTQTQKKKGRSYRYYACTSRANPNKDKRCKGSIRGDDADGQVWSAVVSFLLTPAAVLKHMEAHQ